MKFFTTLLAMFCFFNLSAQSDSLSIHGIVSDENGENISFANVTLLKNGNQILGTTTDLDGKYALSPIKQGDYVIKFSFVGYQTKKITGISLLKNTEVNTVLSQGVFFCGAIIEMTIPIIRKDETTSGRTFSRQEIQYMPF